jgi:predicted CoA-binding protein
MLALGTRHQNPLGREYKMTTLREAADDFLSQRRLAVAGVSHDSKQSANLVFRRLRDTRHEVFPVNPNAEEAEGEQCFSSVTAIPDGVDGVVIVTPPNATLDVAGDCATAGVGRVWIHRGVGPGSSSDEAVRFCHEHGISVIPGGCPCMFGATSDPGHKCLRAMLRVTGKLPRTI